MNAEYTVYISCPSLSSLSLDNRYLENGKIVRDSVANERWYAKNELSGFVSDSLLINQDNGSYLVMDSNKITRFGATVGASSGSQPILEIAKGNIINSARFNIESNTDFRLYAPVSALDLHMSDTATISLSGNATNILHNK